MGAAAIVGGIGAVASIGSGLLNSHASSSAAQTQADAANRAADIAHQQYLQTRADLSPYNVTGQAAIGRLSQMYGLGGTAPSVSNPAAATSAPAVGAASGTTGGSGYQIVPSTQWVSQGGEGGGTQQVGTYNVIDPQGNVVDTYYPDSPNFMQQILAKYPGATQPGQQPQGGAAGSSGSGGGGGTAAAGPQPMSEQQFLEQTPGYQFALSQGLKSVQSSAAARGLGVSGAALKGAAAYATGLADNTYQTNLLQPLQYLGSLGENAAAQTGTIGSGLAQAQAQSITGAGNALAAGQVGSANALSSGINGIGNSAQNYLLYSQLQGAGSSGNPGGFTGVGVGNPNPY